MSGEGIGELLVLNESHNADVMQRIVDAADAINTVTHRGSLEETAAARHALALAVGAARDLAISWQTIGDALGLRRGNAYQRFRQRPPSHELDIHESPIDGVTVLAVRGELDAYTAPRVVVAINAALADAPMGLIVDLLQLAFVSSVGMTALVAGDQLARLSGKRFGVVVGTVINRPLKLAGVDQLLDTYPTVHAAMSGLHELADEGATSP